MTNVITFRAASKQRASVADGSERAMILFFTGVRYERMPDVEQLPAADGMTASLAAPALATREDDQHARRKA